MSRAVFHPAAEAEFIAAARFYENHARRLRRLLVHRFPYGVLYRVEPDQTFIVAVANLRRRPGYWRRRR